MTILWKPIGTLDVATAATDLPENSDGKNISSGALARCKNLRLQANAKATTRYGSKKIIATASAGLISKIVAQSGTLYTLADTLINEDDTSIKTGLASGEWDAIQYNQFNDTVEQVFATNGVDRVRIDGSTVYDWGIAAPSAAPTVAAGASTGLTGAYLAKITYARLVSGVVVSESNPSAASSSVTLADESMSITWVASADSQVTHVRVYRTSTGGSSYDHDQDVAVGTLTVDTTTADSGLGTTVATTHDRPPKGAVVAGPFYDGVCFLGKSNLLYYCLSKQPEYWPSTQFVEIGSKQFPIKAIVDFGGQAYALTEKQLWFIQGTGVNTIHPIPLKSMTGTVSKNGAVGIEGHGIFHVGLDGIYLYASAKDRKITEAAFDPIFQGTTTNGITGVSEIATSWLHQFGNQLYFHYGAGNVLVFNLDTGKTVYHAYDQQLYAPCTDVKQRRFVAADASRFVRQIEDPGSTTDDGTAIAWESESKEFTLQTRAHFPRFVKWDVDGTAAGALLLDGVSHQTHALTVSRSTARRLVKTGNGNRCSFRLTGTGTVTIYAAEME